MNTAVQVETLPARSFQDVPGPRGLPFLGVARQLLVDPFPLLERCAAEYGGIVRLPMPGPKAFMLSDPDLVRFALLETEKSVRKPDSVIKRVELALGMGLVTSQGDLWRRNRRIINPVFQKDKLRDLEPIIHSVGQATIDRWQDAEVVDLREEMGRALLDLVIRGLFAADETALARFDDVANSLMTLFRFVARQFVAAIPYDMFLPTPLRIKAEYHRRRFDRMVADMVAERQASGADLEDTLGLLIRATDPETGASLTPSEIADEVRTMFLAGYETTATALVCAFRLLAENPDCRERLENELDTVLGGRMPTMDDVMKLPYLVQVFHEVLRLYPPAWIIARTVPQDTEVGGYLIPEGSLLFVSPWATHRSAANWDDPLRFDPDRFAPENRGSYHRFAYVPFGGGSRKCVGTNLAMLEGPMLLATLLQQFRLEMIPGEDLVVKGGLTLDVRTGTRMRVVRRHP